MLRRACLIVASSAGLVLSLELIFRVLPVSTSTDTGYHVHPDVLSYPPAFEWRVSTGWDLRNVQTLRSNNLGFAASRDFVPDPGAVALIGDSYVEASMLPQASRPAAQLEVALGGARPVYAMGGPGSSLLDYAIRMRWAVEKLGVRDMVLLMEKGDLRQALCGSGNVHAACLAPDTLQRRTERRPEGGALKRILRHSALAQYLASQLKLQPGAAVQAVKGLLRPTPAGASPSGLAALSPVAREAVMSAFFQDIAALQNQVRLVIVIDGHRSTAAKGPEEETFQAERAAFMAAATRWGARVVDAEQVFRPHLAQSARKLEVGPYDPHLNATGVGLLMTAAAAQLR